MGDKSLFDSLLLKLNVPTEKVKQQKAADATVNLEQAIRHADGQCKNMQNRIEAMHQERQQMITEIANKKKLFANRQVPKTVEQQILSWARKVEQIDQDKKRIEIQIQLLQTNISRIKDQQNEREIQKNIAAMRIANAQVNSIMPNNGDISDVIDETIEGNDEENEKNEMYNEYTTATSKKTMIKDQNNPILDDILSEADAFAAMSDPTQNINTPYQQMYDTTSTSNANEPEELVDTSYLNLLETLGNIPKPPANNSKRVYKKPIVITNNNNNKT